MDDDSKKNDLFVICIGASAGGINAIEELFQETPESKNVAYVVITHLDPSHESQLTEIISRYTRLNVQKIQAGMPIEARNVYVIPPNKNVEISDKKFVLKEYDWPSGIKHPINVFFKSLAAEFHENSIGVILTGTGEDGSSGLRHIQEEGGFTFAQSPDSAKFESMPQSAINTGFIDFILPINEILPAASDVISGETKKPIIKGQLDQVLLEKIFSLLEKETGCDFSSYKINTVARRLERRMIKTEVKNLKEYLTILKKSSDEAKALKKEFLITVTSFFRDRNAFEKLDKNLSTLIPSAAKNNELFRVWVPGCCTGEEAYSIAMLIMEKVGEGNHRASIQMFATDIDESSLQQARNGIYPKSIRNDFPEPELLEKYFTFRNEQYHVNKSLRDKIVFAEHNVTNDPPFSGMDLISCRNLLIYFNKNLQRRVLSTFHYALRENGHLFVGSSENINGMEDYFQRTEDFKTLFVKSGNKERGFKDYPEISFRHNKTGRAYSGKSKETNETLEELIYKDMGRAFMPAHIVINSKGLVVFCSEKSERYVQLSAGHSSLDINKVIHPSLLAELKSSIYRMTKEKTKQTSKQPFQPKDQSEELVEIQTRPLCIDDKGKIDLILIVIARQEETNENEESKRETSKQKKVITPQTTGEESLREELEKAYKTIRERTEELDSTKEEMRASNEELMSMNEEFLSTNEELETSKEELQSLNEELSTLNDELRNKNATLKQANDYLNNLFQNSTTGTIFLDKKMNILKFTPTAQDYFNFQKQDEGRPLESFSSNLIYDALFSDMNQVMEKLRPIENKTVKTKKGGSVSISIHLYRSSDDRIEGWVVTFTDITEQVSARNRALSAERRFKLALNNSKIIVFEQDTDLAYTWIHNSFGQVVAKSEDFLGKTDLDLKFVKEADKLHQKKEHVLKTSKEETFQIEIEYKNEVRFFDLQIEPLTDSDTNEITGVIGVAIDITDIKEFQREIQGLETFSEETPEPILRTDLEGKILYLNPAAQKLFKEKNHKTGSFLSSDWRSKVQQAVEQEKKLQFEESFGERCLSFTFAPLTDIGYVNIYGFDITKRVDTEQKQKQMMAAAHHTSKLKALGTLSAGVAHEINNPLAIIDGNARAIMKELKKKSRHENLEKRTRIIQEATGRISDLISKVTAFARREDSFKKEIFDVNKLVEETLYSVEEDFKERGVALKKNLSAKKIFVEGDRGEFQHVCLNIIKNASDSMENGGVVEIQTSLKDQRACLSFEDNGPGMSEETQKKIFEPFFTTKGPNKGTGLGLSISRNVIDKMGGSLEVESKEKKGSRFEIEVPTVREKPVDEKEVLRSNNAVQGKGGKVLIVDDESYILEILEDELTEHGYEIDTASNGNEAYEKLKRAHFDFLITDYNMPELNGLELIKKLAADKLFKDLGVAVYSGYELSRDPRFQGLDFNNNILMVEKPIDVDALVKGLESLKKY